MSDPDLHPLAADYLQRLNQAAEDLPAGERQGLLAEIEAHLTEATSPGSATADVLNVLERLGDPEEIVEAQRPQLKPSTGHRLARDRWTIALLLCGGFIGGLGWLVGVALLWSSQIWSTRDKWIGTLVLPGGLALFPVAALLSSSTQTCLGSAAGTHCTGGAGTGRTIVDLIVLVVTFAAPILTAVYLGDRLRRHAGEIEVDPSPPTGQQ